MERNGHPRVKRCYTIVGHGPDRVELRSGVWNPTSFSISDASASGHLYRLVSRLAGVASQAARDGSVDHAESTIDPTLATAVNRLCLELEIPWLYAAIDGPFLFVGPLTVPRGSACWECFERRVTMNLRERESYLRYKRAL